MIKFILIFLLNIYIQSVFANSNSELEFAKTRGIPEHEICSKIIQKIYSKLKINIKISSYPGKRAIEESSKGIIAGEVCRFYEFGEEHPTLIRIPTPISYSLPSVFSNKKDININGWNSISKYRIGIIKGIIYSEKGTKDMPNVTRVSTIEQLAQMILLNRIDLFITSKYNGFLTLKKLKLDKKIYILSPPIQKEMKLYNYIHEKHKKLVPKIEAIVKEMKKNGEIENLKRKYMQEELDKY